MAQPTAYEQYALEIINAQRLDPQSAADLYGVDLNEGLQNGTISRDQKQPLAFNVLLNDAAEDHSQWMLATNTFSHGGQGSSTSNGRMRDAGYQFTGSWASGENIGWRGTTGTLNPLSTLELKLRDLYNSEGHRENTFDPFYREIGLGYETGQFTDDGTTYNAGMLTENFAKSGSNNFITGVIYTDTDNNDNFSYNEGIGGATIRIQPQGGSQSQFLNFSTGGFSASTTATGLVDVEVSRAGTTIAVTIEMASENAKIDLRDGTIVSSSVSAILGEGATGLELLGINNNDATGNDDNNTIIGNAGDNRINGLDGSDILTGREGNDVFVFDNRYDGVDQITDFVSGSDDIEFGRTGFSGDLQLGILASDSFVFGTSANQNNAQFLYDQSSGDLMFDADGTGSAQATTIANLGLGTSLSRTDIIVTNGGHTSEITETDINSLDPAQYMDAIKDYGGNSFGNVEDWQLLGSVDIQNDGDIEYVFTNDTLGRWATVGLNGNGIVDFDAHGLGGDTRVVGIYIDPSVANGTTQQGGPFDSQQRFQNDLFIDNLRVLGADDYDGDGFQEVYWRTVDGTAYLRSLMHADGNIQYANYQSEQQMTDYLTAQGYDESTWGSWIV